MSPKPSFDISSASVGPPKSPTSPKKRKRRAPTGGGASDDCFACARSRTKCDRRRPYCAQCLDKADSCPGYKTQLTWGMGVASRGKLRGMSLPVAKPCPSPASSLSSTSSRKQTAQAPSRPTPTRATSSGSLIFATHSHGTYNDQDELGQSSQAIPASRPPPPTPGYDYLALQQTDRIPTGSQPTWPGLAAYSTGPVLGEDHDAYHKLPIGLNPNLPSGVFSTSVDSPGDIGYMSPMSSQSFSRSEDMPYSTSAGSSSLMYDRNVEVYTSSHSSPASNSPAISIIGIPPAMGVDVGMSMGMGVGSSLEGYAMGAAMGMDHRPPPTSYPHLAFPSPEQCLAQTSLINSQGFEAQLSHRLLRECQSLGEWYFNPT